MGAFGVLVGVLSVSISSCFASISDLNFYFRIGKNVHIAAITTWQVMNNDTALHGVISQKWLCLCRKSLRYLSINYYFLSLDGMVGSKLAAVTLNAYDLVFL